MRSFQSGIFVLLFCLGSAPAWGLGTQEPKVESVEFMTEDGVRLSGTLTGSGSRVVILSNQHHATEFLWSTAVDDLSREGYAVLTYNYRGIGTSSGTEDVPAVDRDLRAAYRFARSRGAAEVALVGASLGSIVSLKLAPEFQPRAVVLLSVARGFLGQDLPADPSQGMTAPVLLMTSEYDFARAETEAIAAQLGDRGTLVVVPAGDHGVALLDGPYGEEVRTKLQEFLRPALR